MSAGGYGAESLAILQSRLIYQLQPPQFDVREEAIRLEHLSLQPTEL